MTRTLNALPDDVSPRSRLYRLVPAGLGTTALESLTSFFMRLASAHHLTPGVLLATVFGESLIGPRTGKGRKAVDSLHRAQAANGLTGEAAVWSTTVAAATGHQGLDQLTLRAWRDVLPIRHLIRDRIAYCPACLASFAVAGLVYEPLIWSVRAVTVCPIHRNWLRTECRACGASQRGMRYRSEVGRCRDCGHWLGDDPPGDDAVNLDINTSLAVAEIVLGPRQPPTANAISQLIGSAEKALGLSAEQFAAAVGVGPGQVSVWGRGRSLPSIEAVIQLCQVGGWAPRAFLEGRLLRTDGTTSTGLSAQRAASARPDKTPLRRTTDWAHVLSRVHTHLKKSGPPPSLRDLALMCDVAPKWFSKKLPPALRTEIKDRHAKGRAERASARVASAIAEIERILDEHIAKGNVPTRREVEALLSGTNSLREPALMRAWQSARRRVTEAHRPRHS